METPLKYFLILCNDILVEVFQFGKRRQLILLERIGGRFYGLIKNCLGKKPVVSLNLLLKSWFAHLFYINAQKKLCSLVLLPSAMALKLLLVAFKTNKSFEAFIGS